MKKIILGIFLLLGTISFSNHSNAASIEFRDLYCMDKDYMPVGPYNTSYLHCDQFGTGNKNVEPQLWKKLGTLLGDSEKNVKIYKQYLADKKKELEKNYSSKCEDSFFRKGFKRGTVEFNNCLVEQEKLALIEKEKAAFAQKQKEEATQAKKDERFAKINNQKSSSSEANSDIAKTCLSFGYKKGTEKYADCMKDLYLQQNAANTSNSNNSSSSYSNSRYADEMLEIERAKAKALEDSARAQRNRNQSDALMDISRSLLNNNRAPATTNQPLNCRSVKVGNTVQTQCN